MEETPQTQNPTENQAASPINPEGYGGTTLSSEELQNLAVTPTQEGGTVEGPDAFRSQALASETAAPVKDINTPEKVLEKYEDKDPALQRFGADKPIKELVETKVPEEVNDSSKVLSKDKDAGEQLPPITPSTKGRDAADKLFNPDGTKKTENWHPDLR